jgi:hypothetical protein
VPGRASPFCVLVASAALGVLPGCATSAVWNRGRPELVRVVDERQRTAAELGFCTDADSVLLRRADDPAGAWVLQPARGGDEVLAIFADRDLFAADRASVEARRVYEVEEVRDDGAELVLDGVFDGGRVAALVEERELAPAVRMILDRPRWNPYTETPEQRALPPLQRSCLQRLAAIDLAHVLGRPRGSLQIASWVFVDAADRPRFEDDRLAAREFDPPAQVGERLRALGDGALLVRTVDADRRRAVWRLRADRIWLVGGCETTAAGFRHRSQWRLQPAATPPGGALLATVPATVLVHEVRSQWLGPWQHALLRRLLLTPFAVLADCTVLLPVNLWEAWLAGDDVDELAFQQ